MHRNTRKNFLIVFAILAIIGVVSVAVKQWIPAKQLTQDQHAMPQRPALSVTVVKPQQELLPVKVTANGHIMAWQEATVSTETSGLRLIDVMVDVGDRVKRDQVLAVFSAATIRTELTKSQAFVAEADAALAEASANAQRARVLEGEKALSQQQIQQLLHAEQVAQARRDAALAEQEHQQLRLAQTEVTAPDDGIIAARTATIGAVLSAGQELFRLIRQGRMEWRAEVVSSDVIKLKPGQLATVTPTNGEPILGKLRMLGPVVDPQTLNGLVYVDLLANDAVRPGMFAQGEFELGTAPALTLPDSAVVLRGGFSHVYRVNQDSKVELIKVTAGRRSGGRVEILGGIDSSTTVVESGGGFLGDGDLVTVVEGHRDLSSDWGREKRTQYEY